MNPNLNEERTEYRFTKEQAENLLWQFNCPPEKIEEAIKSFFELMDANATFCKERWAKDSIADLFKNNGEALEKGWIISMNDDKGNPGMWTVTNSNPSGADCEHIMTGKTKRIAQCANVTILSKN